MKLRIRGNSIRLRLTKSEVAEIGAGRMVEEAVEFGTEPARNFVYALVPAADAETPRAVFDGNRIAVFVPQKQASDWARTNQIGIESENSTGENSGLRILIEKDFACLEPRAGEEDADTFANPFQSETENKIVLNAFN